MNSLSVPCTTNVLLCVLVSVRPQRSIVADVAIVNGMNGGDWVFLEGVFQLFVSCRLQVPPHFSCGTRKNFRSTSFPNERTVERKIPQLCLLLARFRVDDPDSIDRVRVSGPVCGGCFVVTANPELRNFQTIEIVYNLRNEQNSSRTSSGLKNSF